MSPAETEKGVILSLRQEGKPQRYIADRIGRSQRVLMNYLHNPEGYGTSKRSRRKPFLTIADRPGLFRVASKIGSGARELEKSFCSGNFEFKKQKTSFSLTQKHMQYRAE